MLYKKQCRASRHAYQTPLSLLLNPHYICNQTYEENKSDNKEE